MPLRSRATRSPPSPYGGPHPDRTLCAAPSDFFPQPAYTLSGTNSQEWKTKSLAQEVFSYRPEDIHQNHFLVEHRRPMPGARRKVELFPLLPLQKREVVARCPSALQDRSDLDSLVRSAINSARTSPTSSRMNYLSAALS